MIARIGLGQAETLDWAFFSCQCWGHYKGMEQDNQKNNPRAGLSLEGKKKKKSVSLIHTPSTHSKRSLHRQMSDADIMKAAKVALTLSYIVLSYCDGHVEGY